MQLAYKKLFKIAITHDYYAATSWSGLEIVPTDQCLSVMQNYGLLFKQVAGGIQVQYQEDRSQEIATPLRLSIEDRFRLSFWVKVKNQDFHSFTELSMQFRSPKIFYWSNREDNSGRDALYLTKDKTSGDEDVISYSSPMINWAGTSANKRVALSVKNIFNEEVIRLYVAVHDEKYEKQIDLSSYPSGKYSLYVDDVLDSDLYLSSTRNTTSLLGIIDIYQDDIVPSENALFADDRVAPKDFIIHFNSRETFWKYYIILNNIDSNPGFAITYGENDEDSPYPDDVLFEIPETVESNSVTETYGKEKVLVFESSKALPFFEKPKMGISLLKPGLTSSLEEEEEEDAGEGVNTEVIKNLPNASLNSIKPDTEGDKVYAEIFVYV